MPGPRRKGMRRGRATHRELLQDSAGLLDELVQIIRNSLRRDAATSRRGTPMQSSNQREALSSPDPRSSGDGKRVRLTSSSVAVSHSSCLAWAFRMSSVVDMTSEDGQKAARAA